MSAPDVIDAEIVEDVEFEEPRTPREQFIREMRDLLILFEKNPDLPLPQNFGKSEWDRLMWYPSNPTEAAKLVKALGGRWAKNNPNESEFDATYLRMKATLGLELHVELVVSREGVCEKKVVGTERKKVQKVVQERVTEEVYADVDVIQFECKSIMSLADQAVMAELESAAS